MAKSKRILIIKYGDTISEYNKQVKKTDEGSDVYGPMLDYIPQFYKEFKNNLEELKILWIGIGSDSNRILKVNNSIFISLNQFIANFVLFFHLFIFKPDWIVNIASQKPTLPIYFYISLRKKIFIHQFLAGQYYKNPINPLFNKLLIKSNAIYVMNTQTQHIVKKITAKSVDLFVPLHNDEFISNANHIPNIRVKEKFNVVFCGRFSKIKGIWVLFDIIKKMQGKDIIFHMIGQGNEFLDFKNRINEHNLTDMVIFHGFIPHHKLYGYLKQMDIGVIPSESEGYCSVAQELLIAKVPVLATRVGGLKDNIIDGHNGFLINKNERFSGFFGKIEYLYNNPHIINELKNNISPFDYLDRENVFGKILKRFYDQKL